MNMPESEAESGRFPLASEFPEATLDQWRELVAGVLADSGTRVGDAVSAPEKLLASDTYEGVTLSPLYVADDGLDSGLPGLAPFTRGARPEGVPAAGWDVRQQHADSDPARTRSAARSDLENGVSSLWLVTGEAGVPVAGIAEALADVRLDRTPVALDAGSDYEPACEALLAVWADQGVPPEEVRGTLGIDPVGVAARGGEPAEVAPAARLAARYAARYPRLGLVTVDATPVHEAGGSHTQELGVAAATGVAYLRALTDAGMELAEAARRLEFRFSATVDQFMTIAKLRAARAMWNRVTEACGLAPENRAMRQHAVTSAAMTTRRDAHVNIVRATLACFGAGVAGADTVTVRPFDSALGLPDDFSRRVARNTQALLVDEAHLARVIDPAGGSFFVERLTADLYDRGWEFLREIEGVGGIVAALSSGMLVERVNGTWERRRGHLDHRRDPVIGVSEYPDLDQLDEGQPAAPGGVPAPSAPNALTPHRYAEDFEALRDRADAHLLATGARPAVFLATLGPASAHSARAAFAANLVRAGGIAPLGGDTRAGVDEAVAEFAESGARVACLCASDELYAEHAGAAARALREAGAERVLLAGSPSTGIDAEGVDTCLYDGCDAAGLLEELLDALGVA
ncbi:methylmalonyl-CoA mutase subunit beta [Halostreptopolyspora alba]|uniref:Methylmalonyl-CoA mutase n=1 Tax=Halostreptopolyspora alba TaxID=2487137 RepID=A0A3N0E982_9ACTN|nr:methylmalonyl-CoA mutase [Nocardiopsaceae bacterium YIM 96095]